MRAWLAIAMLCLCSTVSADVSVAGSRFQSCLALVRARVRDHYPRDDDWDQGRSCELKLAKTKATLTCYGACNDRNCHDDGCTGHDEAFDVSLVLDGGEPTSWNHEGADDWRIDRWRRYGATRADVTTYRSRYARAVPAFVVRRVQQSLDGCLGAR